MRLLRSASLEFEEFHNDRVPPYVILSHTWGKEEVSYQEMRHLQNLRKLPTNMRQSQDFIAALEVAVGIGVGQGHASDIEARAGYTKIARTAEIALSKDYDYFWIDTCCIDKSSSAELQEAINSMYAWYQRSGLCIVHLGDAVLKSSQGASSVAQFHGLIKDSKWITRGWTLQELIAPRIVEFYDGNWLYICHKTEVLAELRMATKIPEIVLATGDLESTSIAQKMSWAAHRCTTRLEDQAYALLGLFDIHMPMLYGEGDNAFFRLQEQIIRTTADDSILAWEPIESKSTTYRGLFARSPREFMHCAQVIRGKDVTFDFLKDRLRINLCLEGPDKDYIFIAYLQARRTDKKKLSRIPILLRRVQNYAPHRYARIFPTPALPDYPPRLSGNVTTVDAYLRPSLTPELTYPAIHCFQFKRSPREQNEFHLAINDAEPKKLWNTESQTMIIPPHERTFVGVVGLSRISRVHKRHNGSPSAITSSYLIFGFGQLERTAWAKLLPSVVGNETLDSVIKRSTEYPINTPDNGQSRWFWQSDPGRDVVLKYDLFGDEVSVMIELEGLIRV
jgi:hypothetical protein